MASQLIVQPQAIALRGGVPLPGDQGIALARIALAVQSRGRTSIALAGEQSSILLFLDALAQVGVEARFDQARVTVEGQGLFGLRAPTKALDLRGDSSVGALMLGLLVSRPFASELWVDQVVAELLVPVLGQVHALSVEEISPTEGVRVALEARVEQDRVPGLNVATHGVFPWLKQALLLAGMRASTETWIEETLASSDHLERAMIRSRLPLDGQGTQLSLHPPRDADASAPQIYEAIGSAELAVPLLCCAAMVRGSQVSVKDVSVNPTRLDFLTATKLMGLNIGATPEGDRQGEPFGRIALEAGSLRAAHLGGETVLRLGDGMIYLMALAACAEGESRFTDLVPHGRGGDPRIFGRALGLLRSAGVEAHESGGEIRIHGRGGDPFRSLQVTTGGDYRLALLATILALGAGQTSTIDDVECLRQGFPRWVGTLRAIGVQLEVREV